MRYQRFLYLAPHTDDAELGCGGSIARFLDEEKDIYVAAFSTAKESLPIEMPENTLKDEFYDAMNRIGLNKENLFVYDYPVRRLSYYRQDVLEELVRLNRELEPDIIFVPSGSDVHQDHQVMHAEATRAFKRKTLWGYELPWNHITFAAQAFIVLEEKHLQKKWDALQAYKSQLELERSYFTKEFLDGLARVRGTQVGEKYAEAFEVIRTKW